MACTQPRCEKVRRGGGKARAAGVWGGWVCGARRIIQGRNYLIN